MRKGNAILTILFGMLLGWFVTTILIKESIFTADSMIFGLYYEQIIGAMLGLFIGIVVATFAGEKTSLRSFLSKVKQETFSFMGLGISMIAFGLNVLFPRVIPAAMFPPQVTPQGVPIPVAEATSVGTALIISFIILLIAIAFLLRFIGQAEKKGILK